MISRLKNFFNDVKIEAKKVNYPKKDEVVASTWVVIVTVVLISFFLGFVDLVLSRVINVFIR
ncbi:MAG TPA: preprotein translocase subunit SecE [Thermodesulfovibrio thiophilus]|uniref:preprotein translocase subunit SecE n=1 Tax=Thermodesulfovibrio thiophilus TaxID=340095 RepID=UPI00041CD694|nr:preprotein translocase subunit SecE [Thermodesulfovibrio thiophilus]HHW20978.1 preprotein translocase subunit SecE [Thermodesulfovibrio thiophilus]HOA83172.1 preprotein translocase subunit SecE [Thermodesulfovibrio thiophilus]HQA04002.1 preprotein translocase subunit SecE [Thermodesulfovibrio thiophilus]HQD36290.1 preprotein translocase subunit SecE [Thermodesulfovibrio thiophilus]